MGGLFPSGRAMQMTEQVFQAKGLIPAGFDPSATPAAPPVSVAMAQSSAAPRPPAPPATPQTMGGAVAQRTAAATIAGGYAAQKLGG